MAEKCIQIVIYILFSLLWKNHNYLYFVLCIFSSAIPKSIALFFPLKDSTQSPSRHLWKSKSIEVFLVRRQRNSSFGGTHGVRQWGECLRLGKGQCLETPGILIGAWNNGKISQKNGYTRHLRRLICGPWPWLCSLFQKQQRCSRVNGHHRTIWVSMMSSLGSPVWIETGVVIHECFALYKLHRSIGIFRKTDLKFKFRAS